MLLFSFWNNIFKVLKVKQQISAQKTYTYRTLIGIQKCEIGAPPKPQTNGDSCQVPLHHQYLCSTVPKCTILCTAGSIHVPLSLYTFFCLLHHSDSFELFGFTFGYYAICLRGRIGEEGNYFSVYVISFFTNYSING